MRRSAACQAGKAGFRYGWIFTALKNRKLPENFL
jgi:hypothetical protein